MSLYPVTITQARYSGVYEGAPWVAFNCYPENIPQAAFADDCTAMGWWSSPSIPVGKGESPNEALVDLIFQVAKES